MGIKAWPGGLITANIETANRLFGDCTIPIAQCNERNLPAVVWLAAMRRAAETNRSVDIGICIKGASARPGRFYLFEPASDIAFEAN